MRDAVKHEEAKNNKAQSQLIGTVKTAVWKGNPYCPDIVVSCVYETKPVHFISTYARKITWVEKGKLVSPKEKNLALLK